MCVFECVISVCVCERDLVDDDGNGNEGRVKVSFFIFFGTGSHVTCLLSFYHFFFFYKTFVTIVLVISTDKNSLEG